MNLFGLRICLSCDTVYNTGNECPVCSERRSFPVHKGFHSLFSLPFGTKEEIENESYYDYSLQVVSEAKPTNRVNLNYDPFKYSIYSNSLFGFSQAGKQRRLDAISLQTPPKYKTYSGCDYRRKQLEFKGSIFKRSNRPGADNAGNWKKDFRVFAGRLVPIGQKHNCNMQNTVTISKDKSNVEISIK
jgi:hypothetical protein